MGPYADDIDARVHGGGSRRFEARGEGEAGSPRAALDLETLFFLSPPSVRRIRENSQ